MIHILVNPEVFATSTTYEGVVGIVLILAVQEGVAPYAYGSYQVLGTGAVSCISLAVVSGSQGCRGYS